jgi:hypothetical protein
LAGVRYAKPAAKSDARISSMPSLQLTTACKITPLASSLG